MERMPVKSSQIKSIGYDREKKVLEVEFNSGSVYHYAGVEPEVHASLMASESIGKHFHANIRNSFPFHKLEAK